MNEAGLDLLNEYEGCRLRSYRDGGGVLTIGWGTTGPEVTEGLVITQEQADAWRDLDILDVETDIHRRVKVPLTQNQLSALVVFCYNTGDRAFATSTLLKRLNEGKTAECAEQFLLWDHDNGKVVPGLLRRRQAERALFLAPDEVSHAVA